MYCESITFKLHRMINMHMNYDNRHRNGMFHALIYIYNHEITCISCMLLKACEIISCRLISVDISAISDETNLYNRSKHMNARQNNYETH